MDKLLHFLAYAVLGMLFLRALKRSALGRRDSLVFALAVLFTGLYGATDELHQYFVPTRSADWWDLLADFLGGWFGVYIYQKLLQHHPGLEGV
jgi:VanZ family protein